MYSTLVDTSQGQNTLEITVAVICGILAATVIIIAIVIIIFIMNKKGKQTYLLSYTDKLPQSRFEL